MIRSEDRGNIQSLAHQLDERSSLIEIAALPQVCLHGAHLHAITEDQCIDLILHKLQEGCGGSVITMNLDHLRRVADDPSYLGIHRRASVVTADGMPLIWASRLQGTPLPERVTGSNLIWSLSSAAARYRRSVYLLGGAPGTAEKTAAALTKRFPDLQIAGISSAPFGFESDIQKVDGIIRALDLAKPDIVYVALGSPKQEELIDRWRAMFPATWWLGVGIAFSFAAGQIRRAPLWMQRAGLEWSHRLMQEPRRLAKRYLVRGLPFAVRLLARAALGRISDQSDFREP